MGSLCLLVHKLVGEEVDPGFCCHSLVLARLDLLAIKRLFELEAESEVGSKLCSDR